MDFSLGFGTWLYSTAERAERAELGAFSLFDPLCDLGDLCGEKK